MMTSNSYKSSPGQRASRDVSTAHTIRTSRFGTGNVAVDVGGNVNAVAGLGGFNSYSTGVFHLKPVNFGALADLATSFAEFKLHWLKLHYVADMRIVTTSSGTALVPGVLTVGIFDDPGRVISTAPSTGQVVTARSYIERALDMNWSLEYRPSGPQARWLETSSGTTTDSSTLRQSSAGWITFASSVPSSLVSGTVGRLYMEYEVSFRGSSFLDAPTLECKTAVAAAIPTSVDNDKNEYELVRIPVSGRGAGVSKEASVPSTPSSGLGFAFAQSRRT